MALDMMSAIEAINSCEYLHLDAVTEPRVHQLRVVILEGRTGEVISEEVLRAEPDDSEMTPYFSRGVFAGGLERGLND